MSTAQGVQALIEHAWLAPLIPITWLVLKLTRTACSDPQCPRLASGSTRNGVTDDECRKLITDAAQRDLKSS